ncbi:MAG: polyprenyl synthetase family protein [Bdellovibrionota bacterium]|nr:polyprenyl synthetase family protein [Bdellovibrionota bacterium]
MSLNLESNFCRTSFLQKLKDSYAKEDTFLQTKLNYHFQKSGKLLRPQMTFDLLVALGVSDYNAEQWALITELIHNASLIHDDLQDEDEFRRGQKSYWAQFGMVSAINAGDFLIMKSSHAIGDLQIPDEKKWKLNRILMNCSMELVRGQELELELENTADTELWDRYLDCISKKTSSLFLMAVQAASYLSEAEIDLKSLEEIFSQYGKCFQLYDDLIDLIGDKGREKPANDLREGKWSSLVIRYILDNGSKKEELRQFLKRNRKDVCDESVNFWVKEFLESGVIDFSKNEIRESLEQLKKIIKKSPKKIEENFEMVLSSSFSEDLLEAKL